MDTSSFPIEGRSFLGMISDLIHCGSVEEPSIDHDVFHGVAIPDTLEGILVQDNEISQFTGLKGPKISVKTKVLSSGQSSTSEGLVVRHPALLKHPELPVGSEPLKLPMSTELNLSACIQDALERFGCLDIVIIIVACHLSST